MRSLFVGLVAAFMAVSFTAVMAQGVDLGPNKAKAEQARQKQKDDAAKGQKRAVEAEAKLKAEAMALAPKIIADKQIPCTLSDATNLLTVDKTVVVEVACSDGPGFQAVSANDGASIDVSPCLPQFNKPFPLGTGCTLPTNSREAAAKSLQPFVTKAGSDCVVNNAQLFGSTTAISAYEVACTNGAGQILTISNPRSDASKITTAPCVAIASVLAGVNCSLTTPEGNAAPILALAAKSDKACPVKSQRYVGGTNAGASFYEIACENGSGYMIQANAKGELERTLSCVQAAGIGGGCTLTDAAGAIASANAGYSALIKAGGFDCNVSKFRAFQPKAGSPINEIIEAGCDNRPESVFALISGGKAEVMNCVRAQVEGYSCGYSKPEDAYKLLTENLRAAGRTTCDVSGARTMGVGRAAAYVEVACSDGVPGFVLSYPLGVGKPTEAISCGQATNIGGGCQMPTNKTS